MGYAEALVSVEGLREVLELIKGALKDSLELSVGSIERL